MIKNLPLQLNEAGKIKIGGKGEEITSVKGNKFRPPIKYDHFEITTMERNEAGDFILDTELMEDIELEGNGRVNEKGDLTGLPIRFLYEDTDLNFYTKYASYVGGKLSCHGDGEKALRRISEFKKEHPCPCPRIENGYDGKDKCKFSGTLTCIIDGAGLLGQAHKFRTTSENSVKGILGGIELIKTATRGRIAGLPLMLTLTPKATTTLSGVATIFVVSVCYRGSLADLRKDALLIGQEEQQYLIDMDVIEGNAKLALEAPESYEDAKDFAMEFHPDNVGNTVVEDVVVVDGKVSEGNVEQAKEVVDTKQKLETETETETETDENGGSYDKIKDNNTYKNILEPVGPYKKVYNNFMNETDIAAAMKMASRLQKGNLLYWVVNNYPDAGVEANIKKPELLELVKNILGTTLEPTEGPETTEVTEETTKEATEVSKYQKEEPVTYPREWDVSGKIQKDQLRELVRLKTILEKQGTLRPDKWVGHVNYFLDADGDQISKAVNLTKNQGENFIKMLEVSVEYEYDDDDIPF